MQVQLTRKKTVATGICSFELVDPKGRSLPTFTAGAHIDVHLASGIVRQYSLCNSPTERDRYVLGVLLDPRSRGGSAGMHALEEGALIEIGEPRNHFPLACEASHSVLVAGGIGVTPILSMAEHLTHLGASFELHYCARDPERAAFRERFDAPDLAGSTRWYFDDAPDHERVDFDSLLATPHPGKHLYVCGPAGFIDAVVKASHRAGWLDGNVHREYFSATPSGQKSGAFQIQLASSGKLIDVDSDQTAIAALLAGGVDVPTSCEQGVCGTCLTRVLAGQPDHRDMYLTDQERDANNCFLPCCSRSKSPVLVLDL